MMCRLCRLAELMNQRGIDHMLAGNHAAASEDFTTAEASHEDCYEARCTCTHKAPRHVS